MALSWNNASMGWSNGRYNIVPMNKAVAGNLAPRVGTGKGARGFEVRAVPLKFIAALEMEKLLKPFAREGSILNVDPGRNMIVVAGTSSELDNRTEERRVGKECVGTCRSRWSRDHQQKKNKQI